MARASAADAAETIDSSRQIGVASWRASRACWRRSSSAERLLDQQQVELVEPCAGAPASASVYAALASTWSGMSPNRSPHRADGLDVPAGLDLELDAAVALVEVVLDHRQQLRDAVLDARPRRRTGPGRRSRRGSGERRPAPRSCASSTAISRAALAIRCPTTGSSARTPSRRSASARAARRTAAAAGSRPCTDRRRRRTRWSRAGPRIATHSPQPTTSAGRRRRR